MSATTALKNLSRFFDDHPHYRTRGFLPAEDPVWDFSAGSGLRWLDEFGARLPELLSSEHFREHARKTYWPSHWFEYCVEPEYVPEMRLYYVRTAFVASAYMHQLGQKPARTLPSNLAEPLVRITTLLKRPPILSYDGYALYNWRRIDPSGPITPDNLTTIQNFMRLPDKDGINQEAWFIDTHVAIEHIAARILDMLARYAEGEANPDCVLYCMAETVREMNAVQARIPEHMDPAVYHQTFREYIQAFGAQTVYENVTGVHFPLRGETGAQSSIMPLLDSFLKVFHDERKESTIAFRDMRTYMPAEHRELLALVDNLLSIRDEASAGAYNGLIDAMVGGFNSVHLGNADRYIYARTGRTTGTGGTPRGWLTDMMADRLAMKK